MGTVAPNTFYTETVAKRCMDEIILPTINAMNAEGRTFKGCLYFGLMLTKDGPKVIEYNCRFGDPETQVVLPLLKSDLFEIMLKISDKNLKKEDVQFMNKSAACVVMASDGYPVSYEKGFEITLPVLDKDEEIYIAGAKKKDDKIVTDGGRVLGAVKVADTLKNAVDGAYALAEKIHFDNAYMRSDIGKKALCAKVEE